MQKRALEDEQGRFELTVLEPPAPKRLVLFAVGGGGNPERQHAPLLQALAARGCAVVAPHFERLTASPSEPELLLRARRLRLAVQHAAELPVVGIGHSIGAMVLLALAGGRAWRSREQPLPIEPEPRLSRLALLAPAAGYFQPPDALELVRVPIEVWAGTADPITPLAHAQALAQAHPSLTLHCIEGAGHFSFLHALPPGAPEPLPDRQAFLAQLTAELCAFATA